MAIPYLVHMTLIIFEHRIGEDTPISTANRAPLIMRTQPALLFPNNYFDQEKKKKHTMLITSQWVNAAAPISNL